MRRLGDATMKRDLAVNGVARLYLVAGNDAFLADSCVAMIVQAAVGGDLGSVLRFAQKTLGDGGFAELFYSYSMLGQHRVAIVEDFNVNALSAGHAALLQELFVDIPEDLTVVLRQCSDDKRFSAPKKAIDLLGIQQNSALVAVTAKTGIELERYIEHIARREGCEIEVPATRELVSLCGEDLLLISNEIKKIAALGNYTTITKEHVEQLGIRTAEAGVYQMISAIETGNTRAALAVLKTMLDDLNEPLAITAALNAAFINLYRARLIREKGRPQGDMFELFDYRKGDRKVSIAFERCDRYSRQKLEHIIGLLYALDLKLKSSKIDRRYIIEQKVVELAGVVAAC